MYLSLLLLAFCLQLFPSVSANAQFIETYNQSIEKEIQISFFRKLPAYVSQIDYLSSIRKKKSEKVLTRFMAHEVYAALRGNPYILKNTKIISSKRKKILPFDINFQYKSLKVKKNKLPAEMIYTGLEIDVREGFELEEHFSRIWMLDASWGIIGRVVMKEKWVGREKNTQNGNPDLTSSLKSMFGFTWKKILSNKTEISIEGLMQHTSEHLWNISKSLPSPSLSSALWEGLLVSINMSY